jgi:hypothetical protein
MLVDLEACARAADAPDNFLHLLRLVEAEQLTVLMIAT